MATPRQDYTKLADGGVCTLGMVGGGSMGGGWAEHAIECGDSVMMYDTSKDSIAKAEKDNKNLHQNLLFADSLAHLASSFDTASNGPRKIVFSLPHGHTVDSVLASLLPHLSQGDIIIDGGNEWWQETERRQGICAAKGVYFLGMGVSGGYQSSRHGPSMTAGGSVEAYKIMEPTLKEWAAKDKEGRACVGYMGPGGSGHYVKMIHNGIEQGFLSILAEAHQILHTSGGISNAEIADLFDEWNGTKELKADEKAKVGGEGKELGDNFLVEIGAEILRFKKGDGLDVKGGIVDGIDDKVTQDIDNSEGTGVWTVRELAGRHVAAPTIAAAHQLRLISGPRGVREAVTKALKIPKPSSVPEGTDKKALVEDVRLAVYAGILGSYVQGLNILVQASRDERWNLDFAKIIRAWRNGCIIRSNAIADILESVYESQPDLFTLAADSEIAAEFHKTYDSLKRVVKLNVEVDGCSPSLDATLGWLKSIGAHDLPTSFEEAELDLFGSHQYDLRSEHKDLPVKGTHHTEFRST